MNDALNPARILIVDDEELIVEEIIDSLNMEGYDCVGVSDVDTALERLCEDEDINLVITDLKMPGKSGVDLIREAAQLCRKMPDFIVVSGHVESSDEHLHQELKVAFAVLQKPLAIGDLLSHVEHLLSKG